MDIYEKAKEYIKYDNDNNPVIDYDGIMSVQPVEQRMFIMKECSSIMFSINNKRELEKNKSDNQLLKEILFELRILNNK
jgi:hypothetical protein